MSLAVCQQILFQDQGEHPGDSTGGSALNTPPTHTPQQWVSPLRLAGHLKNGFTLLPVRTEITAGPGVTASSALTDTRQKTYFLIWDMNNQFLTNIPGFFKLSFQ